MGSKLMIIQCKMIFWDKKQAISEKNKKNAAQRKARYHGSRGGYGGIEKKVRAIMKLNSMDSLFGCHQQKQLEWKIIKPFGTVLYGYYICRYLFEIITGRYINITPNFMIKAPKTYSVEQIDEVPEIWAK
ncbi:uncharacterized protein LOC141642384 isoform X1 [Silene latifolia]|uniref:uncharacterized protein LOC141642384 isoform X1 n=1 Tax=Silene latifolia TaxID=37657 RepID=UPI003D783A49